MDNDILDRIQIAFGTNVQRQIAQAIQVNEQTINHLFNGRNKISFNIITKVHEARPDISLSWLMYGEGDMYVHSKPTYQPQDNFPSVISELTKKTIDEETKQVLRDCLDKITAATEYNSLVLNQMEALKIQNDNLIRTASKILNSLS